MTPEWYQSFLTLQLIDNFSQEKNTWRVIGRLYHDRLSNNGDEEAMDTDADNAVSALVLRTSEKKMVERLFKRESQLRQAQAVVDWLEQVHFEDSRGAHNKNNPEVKKITSSVRGNFLLTESCWWVRRVVVYSVEN